jgi:predicted Zn-dependent peptidase
MSDDAGADEEGMSMGEHQARPEVVDAILAVLRGADPAGLPPSATKEEKDAAKDQYLSEFAAERSKRDRQTRAWELLLTRSYDEPPTWQRLFDDLSPEALEELGELYDALPAGAQEEYARRFGVPSAV